MRESALAVASALFVECAPELIGSACYEASVDLVNAQRLYEELRSEGHPIVARWEDAMHGVLT